MKPIYIYISLIAGGLIFGCRPAADLAPALPKPALPAPSLEISLPTRLSESYMKSLDAVPELTAKRFLTAYENLAAYGPVNRDKISNHARFQAASQRGQILGALLAFDLNGDTQITREEFERLARIPTGAKKILGGQPLFKADKNRDEVISAVEAIGFSRALYDLRSKRDMRPIESYLMLFDLNTNGVVTRTEMKVALKPYLARGTAPRGGGDGAPE